MCWLQAPNCPTTEWDWLSWLDTFANCTPSTLLTSVYMHVQTQTHMSRERNGKQSSLQIPRYTYMPGGGVQYCFFCSVMSTHSIKQQKLKMSVYNYWPNIPRAHQTVPSSGTRSSGAILVTQGWECQVAQRVLLRRIISHLLLTHQVSSSPLCSLSGISIGTGKAGMTAPLKKGCSRGKTKAGKQKASRSAGPASQLHPKGWRVPFVPLLVSGMPFHWDLVDYNSATTPVRMWDRIFQNVTKVCLKLFMNEAMAWFFGASHFCFTV